MVEICFLLFSIFDVLRIFEALQIFFYKFLLKWGKNEEDFESSIFFEAQKYYFVFESRLNFFFQMVIFATLFRRCPTLWKSTLKMTTLFRRCLTLFNSTLKYTTLFQRCKFQRWRTQRCFNVDLTLCDVATSYQPKNNVEPTSKCLQGCFFHLLFVLYYFVIAVLFCNKNYPNS